MAQSPARRRGHNVFKLDPQQAEQFQREERRDPFDKQPFASGDEVVVCSRCRAALRWPTFKSMNYSCVCGHAGTLGRFPNPDTLNLSLSSAKPGRSVRTSGGPSQPRDSRGRFRPTQERSNATEGAPGTTAPRPDHRDRFRVRQRDDRPPAPPRPEPPRPSEPRREREGLPAWLVAFLIVGLILVLSAIG